MNGIQYERSCAKYLSSLGYKNITLTKASGDQGIDIIATKGSLKYGFQCKYYSGTVGNDAVQQAFSGIAYYKLDKAVVITNSDFSSGARKLAEEVDVLLWDHVDPMEEDSRYTLYQVMAILLFGWSIIQLYQIFYSIEPTKTISLFHIVYCLSHPSYRQFRITQESQQVSHSYCLPFMHICILYRRHSHFSHLIIIKLCYLSLLSSHSFDWFTTLKNILYEDTPTNAIRYVKIFSRRVIVLRRIWQRY